MKSLDFLNEDIVTDAHDMKLDHEVQLARKDCYAAAENAIALHKMLRNVSEQQGLEGWVAAKITLANDYLNTVREYMEYNLLSMGNAPAEVVVQTPEMPIAESADKLNANKGADDNEPFNYEEWKASTVKPRKPRGHKEAELIRQQQAEINRERKKAQRPAGPKDVTENAGSVATVVNPEPKDKAKTGTLFGGTYKQKKAK